MNFTNYWYWNRDSEEKGNRVIGNQIRINNYIEVRDFYDCSNFIKKPVLLNITRLQNISKVHFTLIKLDESKFSGFLPLFNKRE